MDENINDSVWPKCQDLLQGELPQQQFNTWIRPLSASLSHENSILLSAPNRFIEDCVRNHFLERIREVVNDVCAAEFNIELKVKSQTPTIINNAIRVEENDSSITTSDFQLNNAIDLVSTSREELVKSATESSLKTNLNPNFTFNTFVEGKANQLAFAAAQQVAENPGGSYNPLFIYGGVGLGKTHLMHSVGQAMLSKNPDAKILYLHSERFVADMVKALQLKAIDEFKNFYRSLDALLIDDIQFFAGKERSQEEFFHTYNALLEGGQQMILTCDRYPKEIDGVEERLKSRFGWGLTVAVEPPEIETRAAILMNKAEQLGFYLSKDS